MVDPDVLRRFSAGAAHYDAHAHVQRLSAVDLLAYTEASLALSPRTNDGLVEPAPKRGRAFKILEPGCGTGLYTRMLLDAFRGASVFGVDISEAMVRVAKRGIDDPRARFAVADAEEIATGIYDLVTSNAVFQWFLSLPRTLARMASLLPGGGLLTFSFFGPETYAELAGALRAAADSRGRPVQRQAGMPRVCRRRRVPLPGRDLRCAFGFVSAVGRRRAAVPSGISDLAGPAAEHPVHGNARGRGAGVVEPGEARAGRGGVPGAGRRDQGDVPGLPLPGRDPGRGGRVKGVFITGTGTGVGKTVVCGLLAGFLRSRGMRVTTQKWVETGVTDGPSDIDVHRRLMGDPGSAPEPPSADRCPYRFSLPGSPHLAAEREGRRVDPSVIEAAYRRLAETHDAVLVEGAGGFLVPLTEELLTGDLVARIGLPILVVAANRLGCVNDALLTVEAVRRRGIPLPGIVFNRLPGEADGARAEVLADNPRIVARITRAPVLGEVPPLPDPARGAEAFAPVGRAFLERWRAT